jgi:hypothetical protein
MVRTKSNQMKWKTYYYERIPTWIMIDQNNYVFILYL